MTISSIGGLAVSMAALTTCLLFSAPAVSAGTCDDDERDPQHAVPRALPFQSVLLSRALADAGADLRKAPCSALFRNGRLGALSPAQFLSQLEQGGGIHLQSEHAQWQPQSQRWEQKKFDSDVDGAETSFNRATVRDGNTYLTAGTIEINSKGFFAKDHVGDERGIPINGLDPVSKRPRYLPFFGLTPDQVRAAVIIHELLHATSSRGPDGGNPSKIAAINSEVVNNCIK